MRVNHDDFNARAGRATADEDATGRIFSNQVTWQEVCESRPRDTERPQRNPGWSDGTACACLLAQGVTERFSIPDGGKTRNDGSPLTTVPAGCHVLPPIAVVCGPLTPRLFPGAVNVDDGGKTRNDDLTLTSVHPGCHFPELFTH